MRSISCIIVLFISSLVTYSPSSKATEPLSTKIQLAEGNQNLACNIWPGIASTATRAQVEAFLSECKSGIFHRLAKARLGELNQGDTQTNSPPVYAEENVPDSHEPAETLYQRGKDYQNGRNETKKDYKKALLLFKQAAKKGHKKAMTDIGWMSENALGTAKDTKAALYWYKKAAKLGESMALNNLGWMYTEGKSIEKDYDQAVRLYRRSIALGEPLAMTNLGWMYETGKGLEVSYEEAFKLYKRAADAGDLQGLHNTGWMYATGRGTERSPSKAADAVFKAIRRGNNFSINQMTSNYDAWPQDFRKAMQRILADNGYYNGAKDGHFGKATVDAVKKAANR